MPHERPAAGLSRRDFSRLAALGAAGFLLGPRSAEGGLAHAAAPRAPGRGTVRINSNENPLGPSPAALAAMAALGAEGGRYAFALERELAARIAELEGVPADHVELFAGSSDPLHRAVLAFSGPGRPYVYGEPGFEAGWQAAAVSGAPALPVPLTPTLAHDARAMAAAAPSPGLLYFCNPNNPTGTVTPRVDLEWALANRPAGAVVLVDEAYIHFTEERSVADLVPTQPDLLVLRTFSKLYGMAGLRLGAAIAQPPLLERLRRLGANITPYPALVAARASVDDAQLVPERRAYTRAVREETFAFLREHGYRFHPSESNCFMLDCGRPARDVARAMREHEVLIGRSWPVWPNHARITIGTREEMRRFGAALREVLA